MNSVCEPVVKSCRREPTATTRSASRAQPFAAGEPVTPIAPTLSGWSHARLLLPACVSATGTPWRDANAASAAPASLYSTPPPTITSGRRAARRLAIARSSSPASGAGRRMCSTCGARKSSGQSKACACTSCGSARQTGPHSAGSVIVRIACGSAARICSGRTMRSKNRVTGRRLSLALMSPQWKSSTCCSTGSGARDAKVSPGNSSTGRRFTWASAAAVTRLVAPGPMLVVTAMTRRRKFAFA